MSLLTADQTITMRQRYREVEAMRIIEPALRRLLDLRYEWEPEEWVVIRNQVINELRNATQNLA